MNVALRLHRLGAPVTLLTRVGDDELGRKLLTYLAGQGLGTGQIQIDSEHPTGRVLVDLSNPHEARYEIERPAAWDFIEVDDTTGGGDVVVFGSLAARDEVSRGALWRLLDRARLRVFDVNLRPPFVDRRRIQTLLERADWIKLNSDELDLVCRWSGISGERDDRVTRLSELYRLTSICVTLGGDGALLLHEGELVTQPGFPVQVVDTIGCGDSFLACWLWGMLSGQEPRRALERACALGALVATHKGANPGIDESEIRALIEA